VLSGKGDTSPGRLRHRVTLEAATPTSDGAGGVTLAWNAVATLFADIVPVKAEEREAGEGRGDLTLHRVIIRKRDDVSPGKRFTLGPRVFAIRSVKDRQEDGRYLTCLCEEEGGP
jgi:SPP1 family predicted phage head-tail adaptor